MTDLLSMLLRKRTLNLAGSCERSPNALTERDTPQVIAEQPKTVELRDRCLYPDDSLRMAQHVLRNRPVVSGDRQTVRLAGYAKDLLEVAMSDLTQFLVGQRHGLRIGCATNEISKTGKSGGGPSGK